MKVSAFTTLLSLSAASYASQLVFDQSLIQDSGLEYSNLLQPVLEAYPEYDLDLTEKRLVQLDPSDPPVLITELEKVRPDRLSLRPPRLMNFKVELKAKGVNFLDM